MAVRVRPPLGGDVLTPRTPERPLSPALADRLDRLYRLHHGHVWRVARAHSRDADTADDVAAETWIRAARSLPDLRAEDEAAGGWLAAIARHAAASLYRLRFTTERVTDWDDPAHAAAVPAGPSAEDVALTPHPDSVPVPASLRNALDCLPPVQRQAVELRADGYAYRTMAAHAGTGRTLIERAYHQGATALRGQLAPAGGGR